MQIASIDIKCIHCGKKKGNHKAISLNCPVGLKTRIGYLMYDKNKIFEPKPHKHRVRTTKIVAYNGCVNPHDCQPGSHGNVTLVQTCSCEASRTINRNNRYEEKGDWIKKPPLFP